LIDGRGVGDVGEKTAKKKGEKMEGKVAKARRDAIFRA